MVNSGDKPPKTPELDRMASEGTVFTRSVFASIVYIELSLSVLFSSLLEFYYFYFEVVPRSLAKRSNIVVLV